MKRDAGDYTCEELLEDAKKGIGERRPDAMVLLALWNTDGEYTVRFLNSGLKMSEMVSLLEFQKLEILRIMRGEEGPGGLKE